MSLFLTTFSLCSENLLCTSQIMFEVLSCTFFFLISTKKNKKRERLSLGTRTSPAFKCTSPPYPPTPRKPNLLLPLLYLHGPAPSQGRRERGRERARRNVAVQTREETAETQKEPRCAHVAVETSLSETRNNITGERGFIRGGSGTGRVKGKIREILSHSLGVFVGPFLTRDEEGGWKVRKDRRSCTQKWDQTSDSYL